MASANLFQQYLQPVKSVTDYAADLDKQEAIQLALQGQRRQNELSALTVQQQQAAAQQGIAKQNALQKLFSDPSITTPQAREAAMLSNPLLMQDGMAAKKSRLENENTQAQARERSASADKTAFALRSEKANKAIVDIANLPDPQSAVASLDSHLKAGDIDQQKYQSVLATLQPALQNPALFSRWKKQMIFGIMDAKDQVSALHQQETLAEAARHNKAGEANAAGQLAVSRDRLAYDKSQPKGQIMQSDQGVMLVDPRTGKATPVTAPDGTPLAPKLKDLPTAASSAIMSNAQNINKVQQAIDLLDGKNVGELKGDQSATGWKGYMPQPILNRMDPGGVDTRAMITDIGSLVLHDRSGAAVTASETPRLLPFIPLPTDDKETARKKLVRFKQIYEQEQQAYLDTYSKDQGYKTPKVPTAAPSKQPAMSTEDQQAAAWANANPNDPRAAKIKQRLGL